MICDLDILALLNIDSVNLLLRRSLLDINSVDLLLTLLDIHGIYLLLLKSLCEPN
jgi:hypothetical protein